MRTTGIEATNDVFDCSKKATISWQSISFSEFQLFTHAVQRLLNAVGSLDEDDYWFKLLSQIRRFRFDAIAAPLSEDWLQSELHNLIGRLQKDLGNFSASHPDAKEYYLQLLRISENIQATKLSRLLTSLLSEFSGIKHSDEIALVVCATRLISGTEQGLLSVGVQNVEVTSPSFLREDICLGKIFVIGPTRWFPDYIFTAPRAKEIQVVKYSWLRDSWKHRPVFLLPMKQKMSKLMQAMIDDPYDDSDYSPEELLPPTFDFSGIKKQVAEEGAGHHEMEYVKARLFLLEEGWAVFLEDEETSTAHVIDLSDKSNPVKKIKASEIEPGMYVLLRTGGGGDFIVPVADQIMGEQGRKARQFQRTWKKLLRSIVISEGSSRVIKMLLDLGSVRANPNNLRNWMSERNIRTEAREDFDAIMKLISLEKESNDYWKTMEIIDSAHRRAGFQIKQMLLDQVQKSDLKTLKRTGKMVFELAGESNISITAFQIMDISPETMQIMPWQAGNLIKQKE